MIKAPDPVAETAPKGDAVMRIEHLRVDLVTRSIEARVLDGVDLEVRRGETVGVVGESGSGKTMTALAIMRLLPEPAARIVGGHIWFEGTDLVAQTQTQMTAIRGRRIAMIPQDPMTSLNPVLTIGDQLTESIRMMGQYTKESAEDRAVELLRMVNIAEPRERLKSYPHQMSGGMRQRVVGAIAIAGSPGILVADEPTTSLDATVQLQYLKLLKRIQAETRVAIIFITHDFGIVAEMCDRVAVMYAGKVVEVADVRRIFHNAAHPYTQALIDSVPAVDQDLEVLPTIRGAPPTLENLPSGCRFAPRCPHAFAACVEDPPNFVIQADHLARCWLREPKVVP